MLSLLLREATLGKAALLGQSVPTPPPSRGPPPAGPPKGKNPPPHLPRAPTPQTQQQEQRAHPLLQQAGSSGPAGPPRTGEAAPDPANLTTGKRLCSRWLDGLFRALYSDLKVFTEWTIEEEEARGQGRGQGRPRSQNDWQQLGHLRRCA